MRLHGVCLHQWHCGLGGDPAALGLYSVPAVPLQPDRGGRGRAHGHLDFGHRRPDLYEDGAMEGQERPDFESPIATEIPAFKDRRPGKAGTFDLFGGIVLGDKELIRALIAAFGGGLGIGRDNFGGGFGLRNPLGRLFLNALGPGRTLPAAGFTLGLVTIRPLAGPGFRSGILVHLFGRAVRFAAVKGFQILFV